jgi:hypothetical protein
LPGAQGACLVLVDAANVGEHDRDWRRIDPPRLRTSEVPERPTQARLTCVVTGATGFTGRAAHRELNVPGVVFPGDAMEATRPCWTAVTKQGLKGTLTRG